MLRRRSLLVGVYIAVLALFLGGAAYVYWQMDRVWNDFSSWTTEQKLVLPAETNALKLRNTVTKAENSNESLYSFETEYCYLYEIQVATDQQSSTLKCSLLPMYYATREKEVPKEWREKSDIALTVSKDDPQPAEFLGRDSKNFESISSLGEGPYPVRMIVEGKYVYPSSNIVEKLSHYVYSLQGKKQPLRAIITTYSVKRLDTASEKEMSEYAQKWLKETQKTVSDAFVTQGLDKKEGPEFLDSANELYRYLRVKCLNLDTCRSEYVGNPANNFMYMLFNSENWNRDFFLRSDTAMRSYLYPFNGLKEPPINNEDVVDGRIVHWTVFSAYEFPICPVKDLEKGVKSKSMDMLKRYLAKEVVLEPEVSTVSGLTALLNSQQFSKENLANEHLTTGTWSTDRLFAINEACARSLDNTNADTVALKKKTIEVYYNMLSSFIGAETDGSSKSLEKIIYESNVYSPYNNRFISDYGVTRYRESGLEEAQDAADSYIEWRSALSSYIMLYLYGAK